MAEDIKNYLLTVMFVACGTPCIRSNKKITEINTFPRQKNDDIFHIIDQIKVFKVHGCKSGIVTLHGGSLEISLTGYRCELECHSVTFTVAVKLFNLYFWIVWSTG